MASWTEGSQKKKKKKKKREKIKSIFVKIIEKWKPFDFLNFFLTCKFNFSEFQKLKISKYTIFLKFWKIKFEIVKPRFYWNK
jgi:L-lactate permease